MRNLAIGSLSLMFVLLSFTASADCGTSHRSSRDTTQTRHAVKSAEYTGPTGSVSQTSISLAEQDLRNAMRTLWNDHVVWTRLFIISSLAGAPDQQATTSRLLQNQVDIGNAIKPYYGQQAGQQLTELLTEHILIAADLVSAAKTGNSSAVSTVNTRWTANADEIAAFLSAANPNWPEAEMQMMMHDHLALTTAEVQARLRGDWDADISSYESVHDQIMHMADGLSSGIIAQFPDRF